MNKKDKAHQLYPDDFKLTLTTGCVYAGPKETYRHWVKEYGKVEADIIADRVGLTEEERNI